MLCAEMVAQRSTSWAKRLIPLSIYSADEGLDHGYLQDLFRLQSSLVQEEWGPYAAEAAALEAEPSTPAKLLRSIHSSSVVCQSLSDLLQVLCSFLGSCYMLCRAQRQKMCVGDWPPSEPCARSCGLQPDA